MVQLLQTLSYWLPTVSCSMLNWPLDNKTVFSCCMVNLNWSEWASWSGTLVGLVFQLIFEHIRQSTLRRLEHAQETSESVPELPSHSDSSRLTNSYCPPHKILCPHADLPHTCCITLPTPWYLHSQTFLFLQTSTPHEFPFHSSSIPTPSSLILCTLQYSTTALSL